MHARTSVLRELLKTACSVKKTETSVSTQFLTPRVRPQLPLCDRSDHELLLTLLNEGWTWQHSRAVNRCRAYHVGEDKLFWTSGPSCGTKYMLALLRAPELLEGGIDYIKHGLGERGYEKLLRLDASEEICALENDFWPGGQREPGSPAPTLALGAEAGVEDGDASGLADLMDLIEQAPEEDTNMHSPFVNPGGDTTPEDEGQPPSPPTPPPPSPSQPAAQPSHTGLSSAGALDEVGDGAALKEHVCVCSARDSIC